MLPWTRTAFPRDGYPGTDWGLYTHSSRDGQAFPEGRVPLFRGTRIPFPRDVTLFPGPGTPTRGRLPACEGGLPRLRGTATLSIFRETCIPLPRNGYPSSEGGVPIFRGTVVPRAGGTGTPFPTDGQPFSDGRGGQRSDGSQYPSAVNPVPADTCLLLRMRVPVFRVMGARVRWMGFPFHRGLLPLSDGWGSLFRWTGTSFQSNIGTEILFRARKMTYRWMIGSRPIAYGDLEGMDWIRRLTIVKPCFYSYLALASRQIAVLGARARGSRHRL